MFNTIAYSGIEAVQTSKKFFVDTFAPKEIKQIAHDFIDSQTAYTKSAIDTGIKTYTQTVEIMLDRTPYVEAAKFVQSLYPFTNTTTSKKSK